MCYCQPCGRPDGSREETKFGGKDSVLESHEWSQGQEGTEGHRRQDLNRCVDLSCRLTTHGRQVTAGREDTEWRAGVEAGGLGAELSPSPQVTEAVQSFGLVGGYGEWRQREMSQAAGLQSFPLPPQVERILRPAPEPISHPRTDPPPSWSPKCGHQRAGVLMRMRPEPGAAAPLTP